MSNPLSNLNDQTPLSSEDYFNIIKFEEEMLTLEPDDIGKKSWLKKEIDYLGKRGQSSFSRLAKIAGNTQCQLVEKADPNDKTFLAHLTDFLNKICENMNKFPEKFPFSEDVKKRINKFRDEMRSFITDSDSNKTPKQFLEELNSLGSVLISMTRGEQTYLIRVEKGVGVQIFDPNVLPAIGDQGLMGLNKEVLKNFSEKSFDISQNRSSLTNEFQFDLKIPCEKFIPASNAALSEEFFEILLDGVKNNALSKQKLMSILETRLGAVAETRDLEEATEKKFVKAPITSEMKAFSFAFQSALIGKNPQEGIRAYKTLMFYLQFQELVAAWNTPGFKEELKDNPVKLLYFEDISANLARRAEKLVAKGLFEEKDVEGVFAAIYEIEKETRVYREEFKKKINQVTPGNVVRVPPNASYQYPTVNAPVTQTAAVSASSSSGIRPALMTPQTISNRDPDIALFTELKTDTVVAQLQNLVQFLKVKPETTIYKGSFYTFMKEFPVEGPFWNEIKPEDVILVMKSLNELMACLHNISQPKSEVIVMYYEILAAMDQLARRDEAALLKPTDKIYIQKLLRTIRSEHFYLEAPFQQKLNEVIRYFLKEESVDTFKLLKKRDAKAFKEECQKNASTNLFGLFCTTGEQTKFNELQMGDATLVYYKRFCEDEKGALKETKITDKSLENVKANRSRGYKERLRDLQNNKLRTEQELNQAKIIKNSIEDRINDVKFQIERIGKEHLKAQKLFNEINKPYEIYRQQLEEKQKILQLLVNKKGFEKSRDQSKPESEEYKFYDMRVKEVERALLENRWTEGDLKKQIPHYKKLILEIEKSRLDAKRLEDNLSLMEKELALQQKVLERNKSNIEGLESRITEMTTTIEECKKLLKEIDELKFSDLKPFERISGVIVGPQPSKSETLPESLLYLQEATMRANLYSSIRPDYQTKKAFPDNQTLFLNYRLTQNTSKNKASTPNSKEQFSISLMKRDGFLSYQTEMESLVLPTEYRDTYSYFESEVFGSLIEPDLHVQNYQMVHPIRARYVHYISGLSEETLNDFSQISDEFLGESFRLLNFCRKHMGSLGNKMIQDVLKMKFSRMNRVNYQLIAQPHFKEDLKKLILEEGITYFKSKKDLTGSLFFIELAAIVAPYFDDKEAFVKEVRQKALDGLFDIAKKSKEETQLFSALLKLYPEVTPQRLNERQPVKEEFLVDFLTLNYFKAKNRVTLSDETGIGTFARSYLQETLSSSQPLRNKVLNAFLAAIGEKVNEDDNWSTTSIRDQYQNSEWGFDLTTYGLHSLNGTKEVLLPDFLQTAFYKKFLGSDTVKVVKTERNSPWYTIETDKKVFRVSGKTDNWGQLVGEILIEKRFDGNFFGFSFFPIQSDPQVAHLCGEYPTFLNQSYDFIRKSSDKLEVFDGDKLVASVRLNGNVVSEVIDEANKERLLPASYLNLNHFSFMEKMEKMECRQREKVINIEFKEAGLTFEADIDLTSSNFGVVSSKDFVGYKFVGPQLIEGIADPYILLEDSSGKKKLVFPYPDPKLKKKFFTLTYENGELKGTNIPSKLYLVNLYFTQFRWKEGLEVLESIPVSHKEFTEKEAETLGKTLMHIASVGGGVQPAGIVAALKLFLKFEANNLVFSKKDVLTGSAKNAFALYPLYLLNRSNLGEEVLSVEEEKFLIGCFERSIKEMIIKNIKETFKEPNAEEKKKMTFFQKVLNFFTPSEQTALNIADHLTEPGLANLLRSRKEFLDGKKASVTHSVVHIPSLESYVGQFNTASQKDIEDLFANGDLISSIDSLKQSLSFDSLVTIAEADHFQKNFVSYYRIATEGAKEDRARLLKLIGINSSTQYGNSQKYCKVLKRCCERGVTKLPNLLTLKAERDAAQSAFETAENAKKQGLENIEGYKREYQLLNQDIKVLERQIKVLNKDRENSLSEINHREREIERCKESQLRIKELKNKETEKTKELKNIENEKLKILNQKDSVYLKELKKVDYLPASDVLFYKGEFDQAQKKYEAKRSELLILERTIKQAKRYGRIKDENDIYKYKKLLVENKVCLKEFKRAHKEYRKVFSLVPLNTFEAVIPVIAGMINTILKLLSFGLGLAFKVMVPTYFRDKVIKNQPLLTKEDDLSLEKTKELKEKDSQAESKLAELFRDHFKTAYEGFSGREEFGVTDSSPMVQKQKQKALEELQDYRKREGPKLTPRYKLINEASLKDLKAELESSFRSESQRIAREKTAFLAALNGEFFSMKKLHVLGRKQNLTLDEFHILFLKGSYNEIFEKTGSSREKSVRLMSCYAEHLLAISRNQRVKRILDRIKEYEVAPKDEKEELAHRLAEQLKEKRHTVSEKFDKTERIQLSFECAQNLLYRLEQVEKIRVILKGLENIDDLLVEMRTGAGKTNLLVPDLTAKLANKGHHVSVLFPGPLEMENASRLEIQRRGGLKQGVERFTFSRNVPVHVEDLEYFLNQLKWQQKEGVPLAMRPESIRALRLHLKLLLDKGSDDETELQKIEMIQKILYFFKHESVVLIDEQHINCDPNDHLVYTNGKKESIPQSQVDMVALVFKEMDPKLLEVIKRNKQVGLTDKEFESYMNDLAAKLFKKMHERSTACGKEIEEKAFKDFVLKPLEKTPDWIKGHPLEEDISLIRGYLYFILKPTFKGYVNQSYGLSKLHLKEKPYAIVYAGSDTPKENEVTPSQFKVVERTLAATYVTYFHRGLDKNQCIDVISALRKQLDIEMEVQPLANCKSNQLYESLFAPSEKHTSLLEIKETNAEEMEKLANMLFDRMSHKDEIIYYFIRELVAPKLNVYTETLTSTVQNMRSQFKKDMAMSATPLDKFTHARKTLAILEEDTSPRVSQLMLTHCKGSEVVKSEGLDICSELANKIKNNKKMMGFFDVGALFKGKSNRIVAEKFAEILKDRKEITSIVFFDEKSQQFHILDKMNPKAETSPLDPSRDPKTYFIYYDENHCYGSDIRMPIDAEAYLSIDEGLTKTKAGQAMGRLRQVHQKQRFYFVAQEGFVKKLGGTTLEPKVILEDFIKNQAIDEAQSNFEGIKQQMDDVIDSAIMDYLLIKDPKTAIKEFKKFRKYVVESESTKASPRYAGPSVNEDPVEALKKYLKTRLRIVDTLDLPGKTIKGMKKELNEFETIFEFVTFPDYVRGAKDFNQQLEVQLHEEQEVQVFQYESSYSKTEYKIPWGYNIPDLFVKGAIKPTKVRRSLVPLRVKGCFERVKKGWNTFYKSKPQSLLGRVAIYSGRAVVAPIALSVFIATRPFYLIYKTGDNLTLWFKRRREKRVEKEQESPMFNNCPIYRVKDVLKNYLPYEFNKSTNFFSDNLLVTNNFWEMKTQRVDEVPHELFVRGNEKPLEEVLVIQEEDQPLKVVLIDHHDAEFFNEKLKKDSGGEGRKVKVGIYNLISNELSYQGKNEFDWNELSKTGQFQSLIAQAKILAGRLDYTDDEMAHIRIRRQFSGKDEFYKLLTNNILGARESGRHFGRSQFKTDLQNT